MSAADKGMRVMPLYMDIHSIPPETTWEDVAKAHYADTEIQNEYDVEYLKYWFNKDCGKLFCLVEAPNAEAARCVHEHAHGLVAEKLIEVDPDLVDGMMGSTAVNPAGAALVPGATDDRQRDSGVRTILFTDIANSTEMTSRFGDRATMTMLSVHDGIVRRALRANGGREVKHTGDGIMAVFVCTAHAVRFACQVQEALSQHNEPGPELAVMVRIGISAGEPIEQGDDLFGSTVQLAARLCAQAEPGQILVSNMVADLCVGESLKFSEAREIQLKGFDRQVETRVVELTC
jgi:class 3 adenylate cyclase